MRLDYVLITKLNIPCSKNQRNWEDLHNCFKRKRNLQPELWQLLHLQSIFDIGNNILHDSQLLKGTTRQFTIPFDGQKCIWRLEVQYRAPYLTVIAFPRAKFTQHRCNLPMSHWRLNKTSHTTNVHLVFVLMPQFPMAHRKLYATKTLNYGIQLLAYSHTVIAH